MTFIQLISAMRLVVISDGNGDRYLVSMACPEGAIIASAVDHDEMFVPAEVPRVDFKPDEITRVLGSEWNWDELTAYTARRLSCLKEWTPETVAARCRGVLGAS